MTDTPASRLPAVLGPWGLALFAVGWTIASAIYRVPSEVARYAGSVEVALATWVLGAVAALCGALCYSEFATRFPRSGGEYVYLRAGWGDGPAFLFGWTLLWAGPASTAAVANVFADYLATLVPLPGHLRGVAAAGVVVFHAALAARSTRVGTGVIGGGALLKVAALGVICVAAFLGPPAPAAPSAPADALTAGSLGLALVAVFWAFDGFLGGTAVAGEVRDPMRSLPRGFLAAAAILAAVYLLANLAYFRALGFGGVAGSTAVAADAMQAAVGPAGRTFVALLVTGSAFISVGGIILGNSRTVLAMAEDGLFFERFSRLSRAKTPRFAIALLATIGTALALTGSYGVLIRWAVLGFYPLSVLSVLGLVRLRRPGAAPVGYRIPWYPLPLVVWIATIVFMVVLSLLGDPRAVIGAAGLAALGLLVYRVGFRRA